MLPNAAKMLVNFFLTAAGSKPPAKKIWGKKKVVKGKDPSKKAQLIQLKVSSEAFLEYLKLLVVQGKETNKVTFKATNYVDTIIYIKAKLGQDLTLNQLINKYDYQKAIYCKQEAHTKVYLGQDKYKVTSLLQINKEGVIKGYFNSYIKRRPFKTKQPIYYEQLTELFTSKMARGNHAGIIKEALNKDSVQN